MKIGFNEAVTRDCSDVGKDLELCEKAGFDYIELRRECLLPWLEAGHTVEEVREFFDTHRIKPHAFNAIYSYQELFSEKDDPARQTAFLEEFRQGLEICRALDIHDYVVVVPLAKKGYMEPFDGDETTIFDDCVRFLTVMAEISAGYGVRLALEPVGAAKSGVKTAKMACDIAVATGREDVGVTVDSGNLYVDGYMKDFEELAKLPVERFFVVHINDFDDVPIEKCTVANRCFCGDGVMNIESFLSTLDKMGYDGMVSIETFRPEYWEKSPEWCVQTAYDTTARAMAKYM